jgi:DeoR family fructose operon transcriptional repressor
MHLKVLKNLDQASIVTDCKIENYEKYIQKTKVKVVTD